MKSDASRRRPPVILLCDNQSSAFLSHRLPLALALLRMGCQVHVAVPRSPEVETIRGMGFVVHLIKLSRGSINPFGEVGTAVGLALLFRSIDPDLIHLKSPKLWCYGGIISRMLGSRAVVSHVVGLGYAQSGTGLKAQWVKLVFSLLVRVAFCHPRQRVIVQNGDDYNSLRGFGCPEGIIRVVRGSGVDAERLRPTITPRADRVVLLPARMLKDKGVVEFSRAALLVAKSMPDVRFVLVGGLDPENPMALTKAELEDIQNETGVEWWDHQRDMAKIYAAASIVCLPSWREGLPKALLEAMACGRPVIGADAPGTREPIRHGYNGLLVPVGSPRGIADAVIKILGNPDVCAAMGLAGRDMIEREFCLPVTMRRTILAMAETCPPLARVVMNRVAEQRRSVDDRVEGRAPPLEAIFVKRELYAV